MSVRLTADVFVYMHTVVLLALPQTFPSRSFSSNLVGKAAVGDVSVSSGKGMLAWLIDLVWSLYSP